MDTTYSPIGGKVSDKTEKKGMCEWEDRHYKYLNITAVQFLYLLQFESVLGSGSVFSSIILKQVWKPHSQIVCFSRTLTEISSWPKPLGR